MSTDLDAGDVTSVPRKATELTDLDRAQILIDIVDDLDARLVDAGDTPAARNVTMEYFERICREALAGDSSDAGTTRQALLALGVSKFPPALDEVLGGDARSTDEATPHAQALRRLDIWRLVARPLDATLDFPAIVAEVCGGTAIRSEATGTSYRTDVLIREMISRREAILRAGDTRIVQLEVARERLAERMLRDLTARRAIPPPTADPEKPVARLFRRRRRAVTSSAPSRAVPDPDEVKTLAALEAAVLETAAAVRHFMLGAVERDARLALSAHAKDLERTQLRLAAIDGLAQVVDDRLEVSTEAADRLAKLLRRMRGGSVGIAGPRGAGKSTIIRRFCDGRETIGNRPLLSVTVVAPVAYDSRDFMLHLFAETCRRAGAVPAPADPPDDPQSESADLPELALRIVLGWFPVLAWWIATGAIATLVADVVGGRSRVAIWGGAALLGATQLFYAALRRRGHWSGLAFQMAAPLPLLFLGISLVAATMFGATWDPVVPKVVSLAAVGALVYAVARELRSSLDDGRLRDREHERTGRSGPQWPPAGDELIRVASLRLEEMRHQQTVKTGVSGKLSTPFGFEVGAAAERSLARHPMTFPEVVDSFAKFLGLAAQTRDVLIAVDELDKLEPADGTATRFLNDLKAAFGVPNTYFLVSVSEDAMSRFERRGLPFRDVFDSTFDEILPIGPMSLGEARRLLAARVVGLPYIFAGLCYVMSGGVPRDLIRIARRVVEVNERVERRDELAAIVRQLIAEELQSKTLAVEYAGLAVPSPTADTRAFLDWIETFRAAAAAGANALLAVDRTVDFLSVIAPSAAATSGRDALACLADELGSYGYFAAAVVDFFKDSLTEDEVQRAAVGVNGARPQLELLARARMSFTVDAGTARKALDAFHARSAAAPVAVTSRHSKMTMTTPSNQSSTDSSA